MSLLAGAHIVPFRSAAWRCHRCCLGAHVNNVKASCACVLVFTRSACMQAMPLYARTAQRCAGAVVAGRAPGAPASCWARALLDMQICTLLQRGRRCRKHHPLALWLRLRQGAQAHSKEEAVKSMQSYKAGLSQALANHEDMLLKAQRAPGEGVQGAGLPRRCAAESAAPALSHCAGVRASAAAVEGEPAAPTGLQELTKDDYDSFLRDAGDKLVIVDFYTDWYAPSRLGVAGKLPFQTQSRPPHRSAVLRAARMQPRLRWAGSHLCVWQQVRAVQDDSAAAGGDGRGAERPCSHRKVQLQQVQQGPGHLAGHQGRADLPALQARRAGNVLPRLMSTPASLCSCTWLCRIAKAACHPQHPRTKPAASARRTTPACAPVPGKQVAMMTGAKVDNLRELIQKHC